jgi:hypothetical protein
MIGDAGQPSPAGMDFPAGNGAGGVAQSVMSITLH